MKKTILLLALVLVFSTFSTGVMASGVTGFVRSAVETGNRQNADGTEYDFTKWIIMDGLFKSDDWGNFQLSYAVFKTHADDEDHAGEQEVEFRPGYNKATDWGNYGGQVIFEQGRLTKSDGGWDSIKPELWTTYNLSNKSRIFARGMYDIREETGRSEANDWYEVEAQYKYDIAGGTLGVGVFIGDAVEEDVELISTDEIRWLLNYNKFFPRTKIFTNFYSEFRSFEDQFNGNEWNAYKVGVYTNRPIAKGFIMELEANVYQDYDYSWDTEDEFRELFFMTGIRYNF